VVNELAFGMAGATRLNWRPCATQGTDSIACYEFMVTACLICKTNRHLGLGRGRVDG